MRKGMRKSYFLAAGFAIAVAGMATSAMAQSEIKIGEINSYSLLPAFTEPMSARSNVENEMFQSTTSSASPRPSASM